MSAIYIVKLQHVFKNIKFAFKLREMLSNALWTPFNDFSY